MSDQELLGLYRRLEGAKSEIKGLNRKLRRYQRDIETMYGRKQQVNEFYREWPPHAVQALQMDNAAYKRMNFILRQRLFGDGNVDVCLRCAMLIPRQFDEFDEAKHCTCEQGPAKEPVSVMSE